MRIMLVTALAPIVLASVTATQACGSPCNAVNQVLTARRKAVLEPVIAAQLGVRSVRVLESLQAARWDILYVQTPATDGAFLFYSNNPATHRYTTLWGGAARKDEENSIRNWVQRNAKGIPDRLATCFAWHVTNDPRFQDALTDR